MGSKVVAGRYELIKKIGDGGMAVVYKANDRLLNRNVAIKILKPEFIEDEKFIENFRRESHAAARLSNPNIVNVFDVGREGNIHYIVMEMVEGKTLAQVIKEEAPMNYKRVIAISRQIATGLAAAHKSGIIHRDVKPHNILMNEEGVAKITDFGIAKAATNTTIIDNTNEAIMGSVHYFSPEQARGGYVDEKSDIYSLGIVMYEMLTGKVPFDGDNPVTIALMHINKQIEPPSRLVPGIPPNLERIVMKCTQKYQSNRFDNANEIITALQEVELVSRVVGNSDFNRNMQPTAEQRRQAAAQRRQREAEAVRKQSLTRKKLIIIAVAAIAVIAIVLGISYATGLLGGKVSVPDLTGMSYSKAKEAADDAGLNIKKGEEVYSDKYDDGEVTSQDPKARTKARRGTVVTVNICKKSEGTIPRLIGKSDSEARKILEDKGFKVGVVGEVTDTAPKGEVVRQDPEAGTEVEPGSYVNYSISNGLGKEQVEVPNLVGKTEEQARKILKKAKLELGNISREESSKYEKDEIMEQKQEPGSKVDEGSTIDVVISKGEAENRSIRLTIDYEDADADEFKLTVTLTDENGTRNIINNSPRQKSDESETITLTGSGKGTVKVMFDGKTILERSVDFHTGEMS